MPSTSPPWHAGASAGSARGHAASAERAGKGVVLDLSLFRIPSFANGNVTALIVSFGEFGLILSLPLWFQDVLGFTAFEAGLALVPLAVGSFLASGAVAGLSRRLVVVVRIGWAWRSPRSSRSR